MGEGSSWSCLTPAHLIGRWRCGGGGRPGVKDTAANVKGILDHNELLHAPLMSHHIIKSISAKHQHHSYYLTVSLSHKDTHTHTQCLKYLKEERTLAFSLRARSPEPVRKSVCLCGGDVVAQCQRLLLQLLWRTVSGQQALSLALNTEEEEEARDLILNYHVKNVNARSYFCHHFIHSEASHWHEFPLTGRMLTWNFLSNE